MFEIIKKEKLGEGINLFEIKAPEVVRRAQPGNFVILRLDEKGERIPITIADYDRQNGTITLVVQEVGYTTEMMGRLQEGDKIRDIVGPLGKHMETEGYKKVVCVGGGSGIALLYPKVKAFHDQGSEVITIIGARSENLLMLEKELGEISHSLYVTTDDGSKGHKGFVTDVLKKVLGENEDVDLCVAIGPVPMMKMTAAMTKEYGVKTIVSLNSLMVDGTGMCGGCRVTVGDEVKFTCVDGPAFDGHEVDYDELMRRISYYEDDEKEAYKDGGEHKCRLK